MRPKDGFLSLYMCVCMYVYMCVKAAASVRGRRNKAWSSSSVSSRLFSPFAQHTYSSFIHSFFSAAVVCICQGRPLSVTFSRKNLIMRPNGGRYDIINDFSSWGEWEFKLTVPTMVVLMWFSRNAAERVSHSQVQVQRNVYEWVFNDGST